MFCISAEKTVIPEFVYSAQMQTTAHSVSSLLTWEGYKEKNLNPSQKYENL